MSKIRTAASLAALILSAMSAAEAKEGVERAEVDEVIVRGRAVSTSLAEIEVEREILVDTATVLKDIPGANVNANGPISGIAQYRGMYGDRVSVSIDHVGVVSGGPNSMDTPLSYVSPMITQRLSVERGIASVSAAPESIGGHISSELSRGDFSAGGGTIAGFFGTRFSGNGDVNTSAGRLTLANERHKLSLIAEIDSGDDIETPNGTIRPSRLDRDRYDLSYSHAGDVLKMMIFAGRLDTIETGTPSLPMDIRFIETDLAGTSFAVAAGDALAIEARFAWNDVIHLMDNFGLRQAPVPAAQRQNLTTGTGTEFDVAVVTTLSGSVLRLGIDGIAAKHGSIISNPNNATFEVTNFSGVNRDVTSVFAEWIHAGARTDVELGLRAKRVETSAGLVGAVGMMGMVAGNVRLLAEAFNLADRNLTFNSADLVMKWLHRADSDTEWRFELGSKTRAPSYQELYLWLPLQATGGLADGRSYVGNLALEEERSDEITIGLGKSLGALTISPQLFFRKVDGYIQGVPSNNAVANQVTQMMSGMPALEFTNVDAEIWGADVAWRIDLAERWSVDGVATIARGRRTDNADNLYRLAPPNASVGVTWQPRDWSLTTEVVAYARQKKVSAFNDEKPTPGYALLNAGMTWNPREHLRFEARADNLLGRSYQDHVAGTNRAGGSDLPVGERLYGAERAFSAGVIFSF